MRILTVSPQLGLGGAERLAIMYAAGLHRRGHEVFMAYGESESWFASRVDPAVEIHQLTEQSLTLRTFATWRAALRTLARDLHPDVLFAQSVTAAAVAAAAMPRLPLVMMLHGIQDEKERLAAYVLRASRARVLAVSNQTASGVMRFRGAPDVAVVHSGVDIEALSRDSSGSLTLPPGSPRFLYVGRFTPPKATDVLVEAFARVVDALPNARLVCVGRGPELDARILQATALGVEDKVDFVGPVSNVAQYIRASDLLVLSSRWEGLPLVLLEALGLGVPAVATRVEGVPLVVRDGETGWLVEPDNASELAERMVEATSDPSELQRRGRAGAQLIRDQFSSERTLDQIDAYLRQTVAPLPLRNTFVNAAIRESERAVLRAKASGRRDWHGIRILIYHRVDDDRADPLAVSPRELRAQIDIIRRLGIRIVSLSDALELLEEPIDGRYVALTFDDGYRDIVDPVLPILEDAGATATVFVITEVASQTSTYHWYTRQPPALSWDDVEALQLQGIVAVGSHTRTHPSLLRLDTATARDEILGSKRECDRRLSMPVTVLSYPAGRFGPREEVLAAEAGYRAAVGTKSGLNLGAEPNRFRLRRTLVRPRLTDREFEALLGGALDSNVTRVAPRALRPPSGRRTR